MYGSPLPAVIKEHIYMLSLCRLLQLFGVFSPELACPVIHGKFPLTEASICCPEIKLL